MRHERNLSFLAAHCASCGIVLSSRFLLVLSALLAELRLVLKALFCIELLFTGSKVKFVATIFAN